MREFDLVVATDVDAALRAGAQGHTYKAGGVDLLDRLKERVAAPDKLVSVEGVNALRGISQDKDGLHIGATVTLAELATHGTVKRAFAALSQAAEEAATPQVRNMATVAGNLCQRPRCWYFRSQHFHCLKKGGTTCFAVDGEHDSHALFGGGPCHIVHPSNVASPLLAADAVLHLRQANKTPRRLALSQFFVLPNKQMSRENLLRPGELVTKITIPRLPQRTGYAEVRQRQSFDWPLASAAVVQVAGRWRVVLGAVAPVPWRAIGAEKTLSGVSGVPTKAQIAKAAKAAISGATPLPRAKWRLQLVSAVVRRALIAAAGQGGTR